jgi:hypothetical protein
MAIISLPGTRSREATLDLFVIGCNRFEINGDLRCLTGFALVIYGQIDALTGGKRTY